VVISQRWNTAFQKTLIFRDNMYSKCSMHGKTAVYIELRFENTNGIDNFEAI
jgi:hypothetical protein